MATLRVPMFFAVLAAISIQAANAANPPEKLFAVISKVEGNGTARVRRVAGTEAVVGVQTELHAGDRILTDDTSTVDVLLHDGTLIRVGIRSEFKLVEVQNSKGALSWVFGLANGTIRSLIEKSPDPKNVKVRINTPAGTMGVRGTEVMLDHHKETGLTSLYTLEGKVEFGAVDCEKTKTCVMVEQGKTSAIKIGEKNPKPPEAFTMKRLLSLPIAPEVGSADPSNATVGGGNKDNFAAERLALFQGISRTNAAMLATMSDADLTATVKNAQDQLQAAQDMLLGRSAETRMAAHAAMKEGTYDDFLKVADAYVASRNGKGGLTETEGENLGVLGSEKFALGKSIVESKTFAGDKAKSAATSTRTATSTSTSKGITAFTSLDVDSLVSKNSEALAKASTWAKTVSPRVKTATATATSTATQTRTETETSATHVTATVRSLGNEAAVESSLATYSGTTGAVERNQRESCGFFCAVATFFTGGNSSGATKTASSSSTSTATYTAANMVSCPNPVTTCSYTTCDTRKGKVCKQEKVCKKTCR